MSANIVAPMPGTVIQVLVKVGDKVAEDDTVCILEAMKMEVPVAAPAAGVVQEILVGEGSAVKAHQTLVVIG